MSKLLLSLVLCGFLFASTSCVVVTPSGKKTNTTPGKKKGWFKNRHNPHNPNSDNPGHNKKRFTRLDFQ